MQVIIPLAGKGTRLRPHTHTKAKPLVQVAGKPVLGYILEKLKEAEISNLIFVVGHLGEQITEYVESNFSFNTTYIEQSELKGQAHAIQLAKNFIKEDVLIWFVDTISDVSLTDLKKVKEDGLIYVKEVDDPRRFGIVVTDKTGRVSEPIEKPEKITSHLVNIGLYYIKDYKLLFDSIAELIDRNKQTKGEFYLVDALQIMIDKGAKFKTSEVGVWEDCGKPDTLLNTNRYFLDNGCSNNPKTSNSVVIPPVFVDDGAKIENSVIGPHVSVSGNVIIKNSIIRDSIVNENAVVENASLDKSIVGSDAVVRGTSKKLNVGDSSEISY